jgi:mono/diheme cytochrome c family protein
VQLTALDDNHELGRRLLTSVTFELASPRGNGARRGSPHRSYEGVMFTRTALTQLASFLAVSAFLVTSTVQADDSGGALYKAKCAACHSADGSGTSTIGKSLKVRDLRSPEVQKLSDADLTKAIADGKGKMPAYAAKLSADQIKSLVAAIRTMEAK